MCRDAGSALWRGQVKLQACHWSTATLTYDTLRFAEFEDFPETSEPVWILGRKYSIFTGSDPARGRSEAGW